MQKRTLMLPCYIFICYILFALLLTLFGPWEYRYFDGRSKFLLTAYILLFLLVAIFFYKYGIKVRKRKVTLLIEQKRIKISSGFLHINIIVGFLIVFVQFVQGMLRSSFSFSGIINMVTIAYKSSHGSSNMMTTGISDRLFVFGYGIIYFALVAGLYSFKKLNRMYKTFVVGILILLSINNLFFVGSNRGILEVIIICMTLYIIKEGGRKFKFNKKRVIVTLLLLLGAFWILSRFVYERIIMWGSIDLSFYAQLSRVNLDNWMIKFLPVEIAYTFSMGISYLTQGFYALSQCIQMPFVFSRGLGSSVAIRYYMERIGITIDEITYPERLQQLIGWDSKAKWHTIFPWLASDFTFIGALLVMGLFIYMFAQVWKDVVQNKNICAVTLVPQFIIMLGFVPANNQIFITGSTLIGFIYTSLLWIFFEVDKYEEEA